jgi:hypothetical protein
MKRVLLSVVAMVGVGCGGKARPAQPPSNTTPAAPATSTAAPSDDCNAQCMANGPEDPTAKADWASKSDHEKQNDCSAACADTGMPVENEQGGE